MATFVGVSGVVAAGVLSVLTAVSIASRFGMSVLADTAGGKWSLALALLVQSSSIFLLFGATNTSSFYLFAVLFGIGYGGEMVAFPILNRQYYGKAPTGAIYGFQIMGASVGMALGGWLGGVLYDATGAYTWTIIAAIAAGYLGLIATLSLAGRVRLPSRPPVVQAEAERAL
jgi:MFS family permease